MTREYDARDTAREVPPELETKSTADTLIGYKPSPVPNASRTGGALTDDEREDADVFPGTFAAGNGVKNEAAEQKAQRRKQDGGASSGDGIATDSGGTQRRAGTTRSTARSGGGAGSGSTGSGASSTQQSTGGAGATPGGSAK